MTPPDPFATRDAARLLDQCDRLRVVHDDELLKGHLRCILAIDRQEILHLLPGQGHVHAMKALWIFFVITKNFSSPLMTSQRTRSPSCLMSGTMRERISATPPPIAVELMFWIVVP